MSATIRLTRNNGPRHSLLTTFRKSPSEEEDGNASRSGNNAKRPSPDIHAAPLSSEEEEEDWRAPNESDLEPELELPSTTTTRGTPNRRKTSTRSSRDAPASLSSDAYSSMQRRSQIGRMTDAEEASSSPKRPAAAIQETTAMATATVLEDDFDLFDSSQGRKRVKRIKSYGGAGGNRSGRDNIAPRKVNGSDKKVNGENERTSKKEGKAQKGFKAPMLEEEFEERSKLRCSGGGTQRERNVVYSIG